MPEIVDRYRAIADAFSARVDAVPGDRWSSPAPCEGWTTRDVVAHVASGHRRILAGLAGAEPQPVTADEDAAAAWRTAYADMVKTASDPDAVNQTYQSPMGPMPLGQFMGRMLTTEILVHTWDLARAAGLDERLDQDAVGHAYEGLKPLDAMLRQPGAFGPKVDPPAGADLQTEFLCFLGRRV
ncbi:MAG TPA: TIGR03086 family metal-binding protein [Acidimicrobiales bacterium]|nr:TIGR03086 family metal-binding protein [Acidimicrobiales bacterium]